MALLLRGGSGIRHRQQLRVRAAHLDHAPVIQAEACALLLASSAEAWTPLPEDAVPRALILDLISMGLLVVEEGQPSAWREADQQVRDGNWWPLSAIAHRHSRWHDVDSAADMAQNRLVSAQDLVQRLGKPPAETLARHEHTIALPVVAQGAAEVLLGQRATCRNFDAARVLPLELLAGMLQQVFMAQAVVETEPGVRFLKKNVPSAGGLHPYEAYLLVRNVQGLPAGVYHYHAVAHELARTPQQPIDADAFCSRLLAGQHWFASAHVLVIMVCRFNRNFWKYRQHAKAYRAVSLDAGHLSQALYVAATEKGLGAFVTAAINEAEIEALLELEPMVAGALAVCGFGWRSSQRQMAELDPAGRIWPCNAP